MKYFLFFLQPSTTPSLPIVHPCIRDFSSAHTQQPAAPAQREQKIDPYALLDDDLKDIFEDVRQVSTELFYYNKTGNNPNCDENCN